MSLFLKISTQVDIEVFASDSTNPRLGKTGLTFTTIRMKKAGGAWATITPTVTEGENGFYSVTLTTTHTNTLGPLAFTFVATGADITPVVHQVVTALPGENDAAILSAIDAVDNYVDTEITSLHTKIDTIDDFLDTEVAAILAAVDTEVAGIKAKTDNLPASPASSAEVAAILTTDVETGYNVAEILKLMVAALAGKVSGAATATVTIRDILDTKNRIVATVDADGNRSAVTLDVT